MPRYAITEKAGRFVAGTNNTGVGTVLTLTEKQAEHEVRLGTLEPLDGPRPEPTEPNEEPKKAPDEPNVPAEPTEGEPDKTPKQAAPKGAKK